MITGVTQIITDYKFNIYPISCFNYKNPGAYVTKG